MPLIRFLPAARKADDKNPELRPASVRSTDALHRAADRLQISPAHLSLAALTALLARLTRQETISILVHSSQIEFHLDLAAPFLTLLNDLRADSQDHSSASKSIRRQPLRGSGDSAHAVRFVYQAQHDSSPGEKIHPTPACGLIFTVRDNGSHLELASPSGLWNHETLTNWLSYLITLVDAVGNAPQTPIDQLPLWEEIDARRFYAQWNRTETAFPGPANVLGLFAEQARKSPGATAVLSGDRRYTYRELDQRSTRLARCLVAAGAGPGRAVAIAMDRSIHLPMALLAVLKSGGFYVPLEPSHPGPRLRGIIEECTPAAILSDTTWSSSVEAWLEGLPIPVLESDHEPEVLSDHPLPATIDTESLAYTIYTSGTTGKPKGVRIPHRALLNLIASIRQEPGIRPSDRALAVAPISFDIATMDMFLPICAGATLVIASRLDAADPYRLANLIDIHDITSLQATPATWRLLITAGWHGKPGLKMLCGGEAVSRELANSMLRLGGELWNCYGPTETTIWSSVLRIYPEQGIVPVGPPMPNTSFYVMDAAGHPLPPGVPGELCIGGIGVSHGYVNRPELNAERFILDPFEHNYFSKDLSGNPPEVRLFRTGDLVRLVENKNDKGPHVLEFFGRLDHQVKLRGYRIELGEIESVLRSYPGIADAVTILREDIPGEPRLVSYVISPEKPVDSPALIEYAAKSLPEYMLPAAVVAVDRFPLSTSGKIDRRQLPVPESILTQTSLPAPETEAPADELEEKLLLIFREVLRNNAIGVTDSFFRFGGYSLLTIRLFSRIDRELHARLPISLLFDTPSVRELARVIRNGVAPSVIVPIRPYGKSAPIFLIQSYLLYAAMMEMIEPDRPIYGVRELGNESEPTTIVERARLFAKEIVAIYPHGPLYLAGWCAAGTLTVEIARQLREAGHEVGLVALFDAERPGFTPSRKLSGLGALIRNKAVFHYSRLRHIDWKQRFAYLLEAAGRNWETLVDSYYAVSFRLLRWMQKRLPVALPATAFHRVYANMSDLDNQQVRSYPGKLNLYRAADVPFHAETDATLGWSAVADGGVAVSFVSGDHVSMFKKPHVDSLARLLQQEMHQHETTPQAD
jgi:amino acid adenylation domain-containing protein